MTESPPRPTREGAATAAPSRPAWHYLVGDIHGCHDSLRALEDRIATHAARHDARPFIVSVGDLIDRGPASRAVVEHFRQGIATGTHAAVCGNHDILLLETLQTFGPWPEDIPWPAHRYTLAEHYALGQRAARWLGAEDHANHRRMLWLSQGGYQTLTSYGADPDRPASWQVDPEHLRFLLGLPTVWQSPNLVVTHGVATAEDLATLRDAAIALEASGEPGHAANLVVTSVGEIIGEASPSATPPDSDALQAACSNLIWNRERPDTAPDPGRTNISGHTPYTRVRRDPDLRLIQVDTGCCFGRRLSAWCAEADRVLSVALRDEVDA